MTPLAMKLRAQAAPICRQRSSEWYQEAMSDTVHPLYGASTTAWGDAQAITQTMLCPHLERYAVRYEKQRAQRQKHSDDDDANIKTTSRLLTPEAPPVISATPVISRVVDIFKLRLLLLATV